MMKIVYFCSYFGRKACSASIRNISLVNGLAQNGSEVLVYTIKFPTELMDENLVNSIHQNVTVSQTEVPLLSDYIPVKKIVSQKSSFLHSIKQHLKALIFFPDIDKGWLKRIVYNEKYQPDLIISSSDSKTSHFVALSYLDKYPSLCDWYQIWGDPWETDVTHSSFITKFRARFSEEFILRKATKVLYTSSLTAEQMKSKFNDIDISHLPRSYFKAVVNNDVFISNNDFNLTYTGVLHRRRIVSLIEAVASFNLNNSKKIKLNIYGRITQEDLSLFSSYDFVHYHGVCELHDIYKAYESSDALLYIGNAAGSSQIPGKLYDYFGTNLPVIAVLPQNDSNSSLHKFLDRSGRCFCVFDDDVNLDFIYNLNKFDGPLLEYSPEVVAKQLVTGIGNA